MSATSNLLKRDLDRAKTAQGGMRAGMPKMKIDCTHLERLLLEHAELEAERDTWKAAAEERERLVKKLHNRLSKVLNEQALDF